jgi:hypothetical protein
MEMIALAEADNRTYVVPLRMLFFIMTTVSLVGQLFTIVTYRSIRSKSNKFYGYVAMHSVLGLPWELANFFNFAALEDEETCKMVGFLYAFSYSAYLLWSSVIAWAIYSSLKNRTQVYNLNLKYLVGVYAASFLIMLYPLIDDSFGKYIGKGISYCWFKSSGYNDLSFFMAYYAPLLLTTFFNGFCYIASSSIVRKEYSKEESKQFYQFLVFPILQLICNSDFYIRRVSYFFTGRITVTAEVFHIILHQGEGLFEALAYMLNPSVRKEVNKVWCAKRNNLGPRGLKNSFLINESCIENELNERTLRNQQLANSF